MCRKLVALVLILTFAGAASAQLAARWTFDSGTAQNDAGYAGPAANGSLEGGAGIVFDAGGNGGIPWDPLKEPSLVADLSAEADYINCGGGGGGWGDLAGDKVVTSMAWYKPINAVGDIGNFETVISKGTGEAGPGAWSLNSYGTAGDMAFQSFSNPGWQGLPSGNPDSWDGQWHHVAGQFKPEGDYGAGWEQATSLIYVDGVLWNSSTRWGNGDLNILDVIIGCEANAIATGHANWRNFDGYVDDVRVYDEFVSDAEIYDIYIEGLIPEPATIALFGFGGLALLRKRQRRGFLTNCDRRPLSLTGFL